MFRRLVLLSLILIFIALLLAPSFPSWAFSLTGEESTASQIRGLLDLAGSSIRPPLDLRSNVPITRADVNPYGINTFLQQEVESAKRERQVQLIAEAGFHWIRQEFPWADIEIHGKGDFEDRRNDPQVSAWKKYDEIVDLTQKYSVEIIARLSATPAWARAQTAGDLAPPGNFADYADFAAAVAERYKGRIRYYQLWNEPNIYPEWGEQPVSPEAYTELLCAGYAAIKKADPSAVVLAGALAPTNELTGDNLNEFVFLQRMYDTGAGKCFHIMSVQGYGLWSGPTDRRLSPITVNYSRHLYLRDIMVRNGDEGKAIWISEMNWNAVPPESGLPPNYGQVTLDQQARWAPLAYERAQANWPWIGVVNFWFFKRADDSEKNQTWYYFRMAEPDFTLMPVYDSMKKYIAEHPYPSSQ